MDIVHVGTQLIQTIFFEVFIKPELNDDHFKDIHV